MILLGTSNSPDTGVVRTRFLRMWAERGLIHIEDARDNSYKTEPVYVVLQRMNGLSEMIGKSLDRPAHSFSQFDRAWIAEQQELLRGMTDVVARAREQGEPFDERAARDAARRLPRSFFIPAAAAAL